MDVGRISWFQPASCRARASHGLSHLSASPGRVASAEKPGRLADDADDDSLDSIVESRARGGSGTGWGLGLWVRVKCTDSYVDPTGVLVVRACPAAQHRAQSTSSNEGKSAALLGPGSANYLGKSWENRLLKIIGSRISNLHR